MSQWNELSLHSSFLEPENEGEAKFLRERLQWHATRITEDAKPSMTLGFEQRQAGISRMLTVWHYKTTPPAVPTEKESKILKLKRCAA
jgi:hypothetical protein